MTRYNGRTTSLRMMQQLVATAKKMQGVFDGTDKIKWQHNQSKKNHATTAKKHENNIIFSDRCL